MSIAAYLDLSPRRVALPASTNASACADKGIFRRIFAAFERSFQRRADEEAGRFIAEHGGLTDDVERQLAAHFSGRGFPPYVPPRSLRPFGRLLAR